MGRIFWKSALTALASLVASLAAAYAILPTFGGVVDGNAWLVLTICPLLIAWPASAFAFLQGENLKNAHRELARTHAQLRLAHQRLEDKASRDNMTGMLNRENFFLVVDRSRPRADRGALLIIDADHFKKINDGFGHLTGDAALVEISAAIGRSVRTGDVLGRIGGEEFGAFLVGANAQEAERVAERIRREVELIRFKPVDERTIPLTVSIGGTSCPTGATISDLMRAADRRLYEAKNSGRNLAIFKPDVSVAA